MQQFINYIQNYTSKMQIIKDSKYGKSARVLLLKLHYTEVHKLNWEHCSYLQVKFSAQFPSMIICKVIQIVSILFFISMYQFRLAELIEYPTWRSLIYRLAEDYPDCLMLNFTIKLISDAGFQGEITSISTAAQQIEVFSRYENNFQVEINLKM